MNTLEKYVRQFMNLRRAPGRMWGEETRKQAPHKPLLLLSVLDLVQRGELTSPVIDIEKNLYSLNELFTNYWRQVVPLSQQSSIAFPFSRLKTEPFWELIPRPAHKITAEAVNNIAAVSQLKKIALAARVNKDLFALMIDPKARNTLREALLTGHFSPQAAHALREQSLLNAQTWGYAEHLLVAAHEEPLVEKVRLEESVEEPVRDQGFRLAVVKTYDHRCALCGTRILTSEGHTCVDAAHITPWSESFNDDIRNGMALCKLCHWAFDHRMAAVEQDYTVLISRQVSQSPNAAGTLLLLQHKPLHKPTDHAVWPALIFLERHKRERFAG
jgi:putative restriction endonuclease